MEFYGKILPDFKYYGKIWRCEMEATTNKINDLRIETAILGGGCFW